MATDHLSSRSRFRWVLVALFAVVAFGVAGYMALEGWTFLESLYMTVMTLTTVGFNEVRPLDTSGVVLTTAIMVGIMMVILAVFFLGVDTLFGWVVRQLLSFAG